MAVIWPEHFQPKFIRDGFGSSRLSSYVIALEAWRRGVKVTLHDANLRNFELSDGNVSVLFNYACPISVTPKLSRSLLANKWKTKQLHQAGDVPTPQGVLFNVSETTESDLLEAAQRIGYPVIIKPPTGSKGEGVFVNLRTDSELLDAYRHLTSTIRPESVMLEQHFTGDDYRILVLGDRVVAASMRVPASVTADGRSTIEELIERKNAIRAKNPFLSRGLIKVDFEINALLREAGYELSSVPRKGTEVVLRRIANASAGGDIIDCTDTLAQEIKEAAVAAVKAIPEITLAGVDILYQTGKTPSAETFTVIEINYRPHIGVNMFPTQGAGQDLPYAIVDHFFPGSRRRQVPNLYRTVFDLRSAVKTLTSSEGPGSFTLASLPVAGYEVSHSLLFDSNISNSLRHKIAEEAATQKIAGFLRKEDSLYRLVAAGSKLQVEAFTKAVINILGVEPQRVQQWNGRIVQGFVSGREQVEAVSIDEPVRDSSARVSLSGDVLIHEDLYNRARKSGDLSFSRNFEPVRDKLAEADISCANLESIAAGEEYGISGYPRFNAPAELLDGLKNAGFDLVNVANNHMLDKGEDALVASLKNVSRAGLGYTGASPDAAIAASEWAREVNGVRIGFVSYTDGSKIKQSLIAKTVVNHFPGEDEGMRMIRRVAQIKKSISNLRSKTDAIVLQLHFGEEYHRYPSSFQRELLATLCETEVDVIVGHHSHVLQPTEWIENSRGKRVLVLHSAGNFFSGQRGVHRQIGGIFSFTLRKHLDGKIARVEVQDPELYLTYVDPKRDFAVRPLKDVVDEREQVYSHGFGMINSKDLYDRVVSHALTFTQDLSVL